MLATTNAIVLSLQPYSDKAYMLHAYTRASGRVNYKVFGLGRRHAIGMYTPLSLLQVTAEMPAAENKFATLKTAQLSFVPSQIGTNPYKRTIALFISEILYYVLRHPMADTQMYDFIEQEIRRLDTTDEPQNFHLQFLIGLAAKLGFGISGNSEPRYADLLRMPNSRLERQKQLYAMCAYFAEHVETWADPKSLDILIDVFD